MDRVPDKGELAAFIRENPDRAGKRDIARAFGLKGAERAELRRLLSELEAEGEIERRPRRRYAAPGHLPPVAVLVVGEPDADGDLFAAPQDWEGEGEPPKVLILPAGRGEAPGPGDRILTRLTAVQGEDHHYVGKVIKRIGAGPRRALGVFRAHKDAGGGRLVPVAKGDMKEWLIPAGEEGMAKDGELVQAESLGPPKRRDLALPRARVVEVLGDPGAPKAFSLIAIHEQGIPDAFPEEVIEAAEAAEPVTGLKGREDLRHLPLVTIDPADARDHDDAVCAFPDEDPENPDGHVIWVAIADVAHYVRPDSVLDREARRRGNSTYFPDRVVPMLPERLSADLCSLVAGEDRPCIALRVVLGPDGGKRGHTFHRGLMRSPASLTYQQAQAIADRADTAPADEAETPVERAVMDLFEAYDALAEARDRRQPLDLDLPERRIELSDAGEVLSVGFRQRLEAHKLIEVFMILANVCAAETLEAKARPLLYRVHEEPAEDKLDALRETAESCGLTFAKGQVVRPELFNRLLHQAAGTDFAELINLSVLRSQTQAYYAPENLGHFGLALRAYAHFTSPIRRYADLVVHRALIAAHKWGPDPRRDGQSPEEAETLKETGEHISFTERRSMTAERDTNDRYLSAYLKDRVGDEFEGRVSGVARFGLFVKLDETGADGLVPIASLGREWFRHDPDAHTLTGEESGRVIGLGMRATVKLQEAVPVTGGLLFELLAVEGEAPSPRRGPRPPAKGAPRRKLTRHRKAGAKAARKAKRR
ncbi:MAG TPA: ribonuclease R [Paracoccaceae bacterium]|nr:ribonuclease R [Paracoccaceae bacterium]